MQKRDLTKIISAMDENGLALALNVRDKAILLTGFSGAFRRSNLVALQVDDVTFTDEGVVIRVRRSKTDQFGVGRDVGILRGTGLCPVKALRDWLTLLNTSDGPLFRPVHWRNGTIGKQGLTTHSIAKIVKRHVERVGLESSLYSGHSLRRGFATSASRNGATLPQIMKQGGWRSATTAARYIEEGTLFEENASGMLGL
jgi:integrase